MDKKIKKPEAKLPAGFTDRKNTLPYRKSISDIIEEVCQEFGFEQLETPALEYTESLGKFLPDVERPDGGVFSFQTEKGKWISLRYDLTAPLARYVFKNKDRLSPMLPFKRYQTGNVWRNEKPGPGRFKEFKQFDADVVGGIQSCFGEIDVELCIMVAKIFEKIGLKKCDYKIKWSNRKLWDTFFEENEAFENFDKSKIPLVLRALDKLDRLGRDGVRDLLQGGRLDRSGDRTPGVGLNLPQSQAVLNFTENAEVDYENPEWRLFNSYAEQYPEYPFKFDPSLVRGLEYYTGTVFEIDLLFDVRNERGEKIIFGSVAGGGRYDNLISRFEPNWSSEDKKRWSASGISIGVDRLVSALKGRKDLNLQLKEKKPLVVIFGYKKRIRKESLNQKDTLVDQFNPEIPENILMWPAGPENIYMQIKERIMSEKIACEIYYGSQNYKKQLIYAKKRDADVIVFIDDQEIKRGEAEFKAVRNRKNGWKKVKIDNEFLDKLVEQILSVI